MSNRTTDIDPERVSLREITRDNLKAILALRVTDRQREVYPRSNAYSLAEGHYPPDDDSVWIRAIYAGDTPVGFLMTSEAPDRGEYFLWRLMIAADHQGNGYGSRAVQLLIKRIVTSPGATVLMTSHLDGDGAAGAFYQKLEFEYTGELLGEHDRLMRKDLRAGDRSC